MAPGERKREVGSGLSEGRRALRGGRAERDERWGGVETNRVEGDGMEYQLCTNAKSWRTNYEQWRREAND